ncbi:hypothetical protein AVEN_86744-1 [Araneus ventricosus]|uniref:Uncharacterized protein n=1 Tax=Araneus ventricosus TaxID=182803 RepID=A0A4Y2JFA3_ARAVE|nr:hypothetical protein AVEN_86744-1 [Araneus ventricosus]
MSKLPYQTSGSIPDLHIRFNVHQAPINGRFAGFGFRTWILPISEPSGQTKNMIEIPYNTTFLQCNERHFLQIPKISNICWLNLILHTRESRVRDSIPLKIPAAERSASAFYVEISTGKYRIGCSPRHLISDFKIKRYVPNKQ